MTLSFLREKQKLATHTSLTSPNVYFNWLGSLVWMGPGCTFNSIICSDHSQAPHHHHCQLHICGRTCGYSIVQQGQQYGSPSGYQHALLLSCGLASSIWLAGLNPDSKFKDSLSSPLVHLETFMAANIHQIYYWSHFILAGGSADVSMFGFSLVKKLE